MFQVCTTECNNLNVYIILLLRKFKLKYYSLLKTFHYYSIRVVTYMYASYCRKHLWAY